MVLKSPWTGMPAMSNHTHPGHLAHTVLHRSQIDAWVEQFHRDGFLFIPNVLPPDMTAELRVDLDRVATEEMINYRSRIELRPRMFETSRANLRLFDLEPIVTFAETLIGHVTHVINNNSFRSPTGGGGIGAWHQDDPPHYLVTHGEPPTNVRLPVLVFTVNYYLTDVDRLEHGPTQVIRGSHLFGTQCPPFLNGEKYADRLVTCLAPAGSVVMVNSQVWHRGAPNTSDRVRYITQVTYGRRIIGHKYFPFMNYTMPEHVYKDADERLRRLLGFLPRGAYG
jgi:ectoine hydroxylase-related dioxygenase (phytanoyl-CoA dioxygenase family)